MVQRAQLHGLHWALLAFASLSLILPGARAADVTAAGRHQQADRAELRRRAARAGGILRSGRSRGAAARRRSSVTRCPQVAFFVNPARVGTGDRDATSQLDAYVAAGHVIADHTLVASAPVGDQPPRRISPISTRRRAWLKGRPGYRPWFRFPFLDEGGRDKAKRDAVRAGLAARGICARLCHGRRVATGTSRRRPLQAKAQGKAMDMAALRDLYVETHVQSAEFSDRLMVRTLGYRAPQVHAAARDRSGRAVHRRPRRSAARERLDDRHRNDRPMADPIYQRAARHALRRRHADRRCWRGRRASRARAGTSATTQAATAVPRARLTSRSRCDAALALARHGARARCHAG